MQDPMIVMLVVGGVVVAVIALAAALLSRRARLRRALRRAPRISIAEAADGQVAKLCGRLVHADDAPPVRAPLSGRRCALYRVEVEERRSSGKSSHWATLIETTDFCPRFWVEDGSGRALVELAYPELVLEMDAHYRSGTLNDATPELEAFLAEHGESSQGWVFNKTLRYKEGALEQGETVAVYGLCRQEPDPDPTAASGGAYRETPMRTRVVDPEQGQMILSDDPSTLG